MPYSTERKAMRYSTLRGNLERHVRAGKKCLLEVP